MRTDFKIIKNVNPTSMEIVFLVWNLAYAKTIASAVGAWACASIIGLFFQVGEPNWYQHPAVISAFVTAALVFIIEYLKIRQAKEKAKADAEKDDGNQHLSYSEGLQKLSQEERNQLLGGLKDLQQREVDFYKTLIAMKEIETFEARMRAHRYGNELNRSNFHIFACHNAMSLKGIEIPEFILKTGEEIMLGLETEVLAFKQKLERDKESIIHLSEN